MTSMPIFSWSIPNEKRQQKQVQRIFPPTFLTIRMCLKSCWRNFWVRRLQQLWRLFWYCQIVFDKIWPRFLFFQITFSALLAIYPLYRKGVSANCLLLDTERWDLITCSQWTSKTWIERYIGEMKGNHDCKPWNSQDSIDTYNRQQKFLT